MTLTYELVGNGYIILNNGVKWIEQIGFMPYKGETLEDSAQNHINALLADAEATVNQGEELKNLKEQVATQEQAITELSMFVATLGVL